MHAMSPPEDKTINKHGNKSKKNESSYSGTTVTWPIVLAVIPTMGAFFAGNNEIWSDFIMVLLILYYVYKWVTGKYIYIYVYIAFPWTYYEGARQRRILHQKSSKKAGLSSSGNSNNANEECRRHVEWMTAELRRHELAGLLWVTLSPFIAGYTLRYSRCLLSNVEHYISNFNITVFILAASIKPLTHIIQLLQERTLFLQTETSHLNHSDPVDNITVDMLEDRILRLEKEIDWLRHQNSSQVLTRRDSEEMGKHLKRLERRDSAIKKWAEDHFAALDGKVREFDEYICYRIEQEQKKQQHGVIVSLIFLPLNISLWVAKQMSFLLPDVHHFFHGSSTKATSANNLLTVDNNKNNNKLSSSLLAHHNTRQQHQVIESSFTTDGSVAAFGGHF
ncbi:MAG: hypothetical protein EXX96DRAFT_497926 [Benjaminiella poitrasii]|nr:MAG: hypothetical protein EXX96DRAFT_497926 [Benjaminiella poitrasii]